MNCTVRVVKTKALISCAVTAQLICAFVFTYAEIWFPHDAAHLIIIAETVWIENFVSCFGIMQSEWFVSSVALDKLTAVVYFLCIYSQHLFFSRNIN